MNLRGLLLFFSILVVSLLGSSVLSAEERPFVHRGVAEDAARYEAYVKENWKPGPRKAAELRSAGERLMATDPRAASRSFATAVAADMKSAESWLGLARALLAITPDPEKGSERYDLPVNASGAAYRAYEVAALPALKAKALAVLGEAMERRSYWRPAIDATKASLALAEDAGVRARYEKLRAEHGFRMTDYSTDSDAASPRVCVQFSESLSRTVADFAKFVSVDGHDPEAVSPEDQQLCIEGLEHGKRYEVQIRAALPSDVGEELLKPVSIAVYVPDRKPFVRFTGRSYVLPARGQQGIPVVTVNTSKVALEVYRVGDRSLAATLATGDLDRQLYTGDVETLRDQSGQLVYEGEMDVAQRLNEEVTTAFPVGDVVGELKPGVYAAIARPGERAKEEWGALATQWFIVSDLGLTAFSGADGVHAFVRSLSGTEAIKGASVRLVAKNNEVLGTTSTNESGYARFDAGLVRGEGGLRPAILVAEKGPGEYAFLDLTSNAFDLSDRGVEGREPPTVLDGYLYTERGVYRPGEEVNFTALVRDGNGVASGVPTTLIVTRPDGVEHARYALSDQGLGARAVRLDLSGSAMTGTWRAKLHADPEDDPVTQVTFLVEDYVPERLDMTLTPAAGALTPGAPGQVEIAGRYLYGPPAADLAIEGEIVVKELKQDVEGLAGYRFGDAEETVAPVRETLEGLPVTDANGHAVVPVKLPAVTKTARPLEANVILRLREPGGRTIERSVTMPVSLTEPRIGIKPLFAGEGLGEGEKARFEVVMLGADGKREAAKGLVWELVRLDTSWQWYSRDGSWSYETQTIKRKIASGQIDVGTDASAIVEADVRYGRYRLEVASAEADGPASSVIFNSGWFTTGDNADSPELLDVALDKPSYKAGDTARLRIATKSGGRALIAVLGSGLLDTKEVDIAAGGGEIEIPVGSDWGPGAYATALLYRPMDEAEKRMPSRAIGVSWIGVDQKDRTLGLTLASEAKIKSGSTLKVPVKISGLGAGEEARLTVAAVDVGILNLTRFEAPAPELHFYAQRKLGMEIRDFYGRLIDGMRAERGKLRSGGDGMDSAGLKGSPPVEETVAFYSGIVRVESDGSAEVSFDMPDFNGSVRLMAVAWSNDKVGHATGDVIVRDAVALTASAPRFLTLGDEATLDVSLHNIEGPAAQYGIAVGLLPEDELAGTPQTVASLSLDLKAGERKSATTKVKPAEVGLHTYLVKASGPDTIAVERRLTFDVKPPAGDVKRTTVKALAANGGKITLSRDMVAGLITERTRVNVSVGPTARLDVPGLLTALDRYPYGCAEQTVSRAMPLLYANAVAARIGIAEDKEIRARIDKAIAHVLQMQDSSGAFGIWSPGSGDLWLTGYVTDFLTRAREQGFVVPQRAFSQALDRLANFIANAEDFEQGGEDRAYALYVLSRNGRAPIGELRYYADTRLDRFSTPLARAQLGAALSMAGDKTRAEAAFSAALSAFDGPDDTASLARGDYGSSLRDGAALVTLASETGVARSEAPRLVNVIAKAYTSRAYTSTQEQAWLLLAANALGDETKGTSLSIGGEAVKGSIIRSLTVDDLEKGLTITNQGNTPVDAVISVIGAGLTPEPAIEKGFKIERSFYKPDGTPVDLASASGGKASIRQNERLVAVVKIESDEASGRVLLVDHLPAGLEIENPHLVDSGDVKALDWLKSDITPEHTEFRDDRFVAAFDMAASGSRSSDNEESANDESSAEPQEGTDAAGKSKAPAAAATVAYLVRAVTPGLFVHPAATVEDMYRPERHARTASGLLTVEPGE